MGVSETLIKKIHEALDEIRPMLQKDGGDIDFIKFENSIVYVSLKGACKRCPFSFMTIRFGVEESLKNAIPSITAVVVVP